MPDPTATTALARALYEANCFDPNSIYHEFKMAEVERFAKDILRVPLTPAQRAAIAAAILTPDVLAEVLKAASCWLYGWLEYGDTVEEAATVILAALREKGADRG